jgi:hypothetical protein
VKNPIPFCIGTALLFLFGCRTISPVAPQYKVTPLPPMSTSLSIIHVPINLELKSYLYEAERAIPSSLKGSEENCSGVSYQYNFKRDPILFNGSGTTMTYKVNGQYSISMNYCPTCTYIFDDNGTCVIPRIYLSCGVDEPMRKMSISYATQIAVNNDYSFESTTTLQDFQLLDPCEVSFFSFDVSSQLKKQLKPVLSDLEKVIDTQIEALNIKPQLNDLWEMACEPIPIEKYGYLNINPKNISLNGLTFKGTKALLDVVVSLQPLFTTSTTKANTSKLPNLSKINAEEGFKIDLDVFAGYDSLSSILNDQIKGDTIFIKHNAFIMNNLRVSGTNDQEITLEINFGGKRKGTIFLKGKPYYDAQSQEISFPELDFDLSSKNLLLRTAKWILNEKIISTIKEQAKFNIESELDKVKKHLQSELNKNNNPQFNLKAEIKDLDLTQVFLDDKNIVLRIQTKGDVSVSVK